METSSTTDILSLQLPVSLSLEKCKYHVDREVSEKPADKLHTSNLD